MQYTLLLILSLLFIVSLLVMIGQKLRISYPIFLVLAGLGIGLINKVPRIEIAPELIFMIFLPPLLYEAAWYTSWNDFWRWRRPIGLLAFGLVIFTSCGVAFMSNAIIPDFTLPLGFLLGGIISPPDAIAATSVLKGVKVPRRVLTILEGESLVNDASSLIVFRFALAAIVTRTFVFQQAFTSFFLVTLMGILIGLAIAHVFYVIHRWLPTTSGIDTALTIMAPYFMYLGAEYFHYSGIMAVVSGGLFLSYRAHELFNYRSRIQSAAVWSTIVFILNGLVFILIGLQLPLIVEGLGEYSLGEAITYALIISGFTIFLRLAWVFPTTFIPRWISKKIRKTENSPGWKGPLIVGWAGMRGVVSLASALSIPLMLTNGQAFPHRNLILFITFVVILITLVFQGLTLPLIIRWIKIEEIDDMIPEEEQEEAIKIRLMKAALKRLTEKYNTAIETNELLKLLKKDLENDITITTEKLESLECREAEKKEIKFYNKVLRDLFQAQRRELFQIRKEKLFSDAEIRKHETFLDLDEAKINKYTY